MAVTWELGSGSSGLGAGGWGLVPGSWCLGVVGYESPKKPRKTKAVGSTGAEKTKKTIEKSMFPMKTVNIKNRPLRGIFLYVCAVAPHKTCGNRGPLVPGGRNGGGLQAVSVLQAGSGLQPAGRLEHAGRLQAGSGPQPARSGCENKTYAAAIPEGSKAGLRLRPLGLRNWPVGFLQARLGCAIKTYSGFSKPSGAPRQ